MSFLSRIMVLKSKAHFNTGAGGREIGAPAPFTFEGTRKSAGGQTRNRIAIMIGAFTIVYAVIGGRLVQYGLTAPQTVASIMRADNTVASRPDILDRNGEVLATDVRTVSLPASEADGREAPGPTRHPIGRPGGGWPLDPSRLGSLTTVRGTPHAVNRGVCPKP